MWLIRWAFDQGIRLEHTQQGNPQQNAYIERYNRTVACLVPVGIDRPVQESATCWLWTYNNERLNMAIGGVTPRQKLV